MSISAENPYAPTGNETATGEYQLLYNPGKVKQNILAGSELGATEGWKMQCLNLEKKLESGSTMTVGDQKLVPIKVSNGATNKVTLPAGKVANAVYIYSTINKDAATNRPCYWKEVDGVTYEAPETDNLTSFKDFANPDVSYFTLKGNNSFTFTNGGEQPFVVLKVDYSDANFGSATLAPTSVWPGNGATMLPINGNITLTFAGEVHIAGSATLNDAAADLAVTYTTDEAGAVTSTVNVACANLTPLTQYTLSIPAGVIGNAEGSNEALTYTYTTEMADVEFYSDFHFYPKSFYDLYGNITENFNIIAKGSTDKTATAGGMTFYSGTKGRVVFLSGNVNGATTDVDYGPYTEEDFGASNRAVQLIDGGNGLYVEFPEVTGPADVTFFIANASGKAGTIVLTDELGDTENPLAKFELAAAKRMFKLTYNYPYKGTVRLRLYNMKNQIDINDVIIVKGEGEGIDKPEPAADETAPALLKSWPSAAAYAPVEGTITLIYDEPIVVTGKAVVNGVETDVVVDNMTATIAYSGLQKGQSYSVTIPAVADEAGNANEAFDMTIATEAEDVIYYTDFQYYPYAYWEKYHNIPNAGGDNEDIIAKNSTDVTATVAGLTYYSGTSGRVVAMGKSNIQAGNEEIGASDRCIQVSGGEDGLYVELEEMNGPCEITVLVGNSTGKATKLELRNAKTSTTDAVATLEMTEQVMYKLSYKFGKEEPVQFRLYNMSTQFNIHDILVKVAEKDNETGIDAIVAEEADDAIYYNLQGVRVNNPANGLYIRVSGKNVTKVLVK